MSQGLKEKLFHGGLWALGGKIMSILCAFILNVVLTRALTPAEYGAYFVAFNTVIILATVGTFGVDQVAVRFTAICVAASDFDGVRIVIARCLGVVFTGALLVCTGFYLIAPWFFTEVVKVPVVAAFAGFMVLWIFLATFQRQLAETFRGLKDIRRATLFGGIRNNGVIVSMISSLIVAIAYGFGVLNLLTTYLIMSFSSLVVVAISIRSLWNQTRTSNNASDNNIKPIQSYYGLNTILREGWPLWFAAVLGVLNLQGDGWLAASFDTPDNVALYGAAQRFVALIMAPLAIVNALLPPFVAEMHASNEINRLEKIVRAVAGLAGMPALIVLIVLILFGRSIMGVLFGEHYESAYLILVMLGVGQFVNVMTGSCFIVLAMTGHKQDVMKITFISALVLLIGGVLGGSVAGALGVAIASCISISLHNFLGMLSVKRKLNIWTFVALDPNLFIDLFCYAKQRISARSALQ